MMEAVKKNDVNRVTKFTNGGLDPNFSDTDTGGCTLNFVFIFNFSILELRVESLWLAENKEL